MQTIHVTREGVTMPIAEMDDQHLINMIKFIGNQIGKLKNAARTPADTIQARLVGARPIDIEAAASAIMELIEKAQPYLIEAYLRNLDEGRVLLCQIYERTGAIPKGDTPLLERRIGMSDLDLEDQEF